MSNPGPPLHILVRGLELASGGSQVLTASASPPDPIRELWWRVKQRAGSSGLIPRYLLRSLALLLLNSANQIDQMKLNKDVAGRRTNTDH